MSFTTAIADAAANTDMNKPMEVQITQAELERQMAAFGKARAEQMMARNETAGTADNNPYAQAIYRRYIMPLAAMIREDVTTKRAGRNQAHVTLLEPVDPEATAFLAVRSVLNSLMGARTGSESPGRKIIGNVGRDVHRELLLTLFSEINPDLFYSLVNDLSRRMSKSERHRITVFKMQMKQAGIEVPEWGENAQQQVGAYLLDRLEILGMVDIKKWTATDGPKNKTTIDIGLSEQALGVIGSIKDMIVETTPYFLPCIEQPKDWVSIMDGGYHTVDMRRLQPFCVKAPSTWSKIAEHDLTRVFAAINGLQQIKWQVNNAMLDTIRKVARHFDMDEIVGQAENPAPPQPTWLLPDMKVEHMSADEEQEFLAWKRAKREWYTAMKLRGTKYGRFVTAMQVASKFAGFPEIYFVYFSDFRGRLYAQTTGISPQGSDLQKALIRFANGKPLDSIEAERWFCINGANKWGFDKCGYDGRVEWVKKHHDNIMSFGEDPVSNRGWQEADSPLQFLAWCLEYKAWQDSPHNFVSHLPIGMDGSCNGLQNFSAMLRDEVGGRATNLVPADKPNDIYQDVADVTAFKLRNAEPWEVPMAVPDDADNAKAIRKAEFANKHRVMWIKHGCSRSLVKRSVMTLPYGSTRFSCADFIAADYLKEGKAPEFSKEEYGQAAQFLSHHVWDSIGEVVVKAKEAMDWLQSNTKRMIGDGEEIHWVAPDGFPVYQQYWEYTLHRINTKLQGNTKIRMHCETDDPCVRKHKNGIAPNFIHSHDAAHMKLVINASRAEGLDLAMIHDDYGTHASDAAKLYRIIREVFVAMYEQHDPLTDLAERYDLPPAPERGNLDLRQVLNSPYFFS